MNICLKMSDIKTNILNTLFDAHKFSATEIFSNNNGKTSSTKVVGFVASMVCLLLFIILIIYYLINPAECPNILELIDRTITYFTVSAGLMGIKSVTSAFGKSRVELIQTDEIKHNHTFGTSSDNDDNNNTEEQ